MMSAGRGGRRGPRSPCPYPHGRGLAAPREAACGCGDGIRQGSLSLGIVPACRLASTRRGDCPGPSAGRTVAGGFCMCQRGNQSRVVAAVGVPGSYGVPPALEAPGRFGTTAAGGLRRVLGSPLTQGFSRYHGPAWSHGCAGRRAGATASGVHSFHPGCRSHMRHQPVGHIVPLGGVVHGGRGRLPRPMAKGDVCHGAGSLRQVAGSQGKQPSDADCQGELFPCGKPGDPEAQVSGRRLFRLFARAVGVALQACVVQLSPPPGGAVPGRGPVGSLAVLVAASTRAPSSGAPRLSVVRSAPPLAVACRSPAAVTCPRAV